MGDAGFAVLSQGLVWSLFATSQGSSSDSRGLTVPILVREVKGWQSVPLRLCAGAVAFLKGVCHFPLHIAQPVLLGLPCRSAWL